MLYYYLFLAITMIFAAIYDKNPQKKMSLYTVLVIMTLFAGLRSAEVGTDAAGYARRFMSESRELTGDFWEQIKSEPGFYYLNNFLGMLSKNYWVLFTGIALLTYSCVLKAVKSETDKILIPIFIFITLGFYTFVFNAARQGIAVAIYMLSYRYLFDDIKKGFPRYCFFVLLAALFHKTVIIALPLYFLFRQRFSIKICIIIVLLGVLIAMSLPAFFIYAGSIESRYMFYSTQASGGELLTVFYVLMSVFFIMWRSNVDKRYKRKYDVFLNMMLFGTLIYVVVQLTGVYVELTRFAAYFQVSAIFLWGFIYLSRKKPSISFSLVIVIGHLLFYFIFCTRMASLVPYKFNPEIAFL